MQIIKRITFIVLLFSCQNLFAQTTFLPEGSKEYQLIDRLEIKYGKNTDLIFSTLKPYSRRSLVQQAEWIEKAAKQAHHDSRTTARPLSIVSSYLRSKSMAKGNEPLRH